MGNIESRLRRGNIPRKLLGFPNRNSATLASETLRSSDPVVSRDRYEACSILGENGLCNVIWLEDLLALHGSNTQVWDLNLLVQDPRAAATVLLNVGYMETPTDSKFEDDAEFAERGIRMARFPSATGVTLLPARDWYYDLTESVQDCLPPIHKFLDSMIGVWLNISSRDYVDRVRFALYLGCLICYCYYLKDANGEVVKDPAYAMKLKPEHREVHYDIVADYAQQENFTTTSRHQYHARRSREITEGTFTPQPYQKAAFRLPLTTLPE